MREGRRRCQSNIDEDDDDEEDDEEDGEEEGGDDEEEAEEPETFQVASLVYACVARELLQTSQKLLFCLVGEMVRWTATRQVLRRVLQTAMASLVQQSVTMARQGGSGIAVDETRGDGDTGGGARQRR
ncbi:unnamed protein product [Vitrella brassicaformis CCMP3155]|uniref:Uncharacterized protein n=1 Tax=Vitrella brassicaformis (strain CCMP3155) TaxID=1169540 RepID=A0A0G4FS48_VITBC|nr:unnamed protein product [Vitrella brassicaformis CCMP3155]|eukprot:CEM17478.1 unnamed protein product [Vitrella brassicaformis CCMP3155]